jgi:enolase
VEKYMVTLTKSERKELEEIIRKGKHKSQRVINALILLNCDEGEFQDRHSTNAETAQILKVSMRKIDRVKKRFVVDGLDVALNGKRKNRVYKKKVNGDFEAHLVALSCSEPPKGFARWSLRLLADKAVELNYIESISHETVRRVLRKRT